jgi:hypothetical protein
MLSHVLNYNSRHLQKLFGDLVMLAWEILELAWLLTFDPPFPRYRSE